MLIDRTLTLGKRQAIAGVEHALVGMKATGSDRWRATLKGAKDIFRGCAPEGAALKCRLKFLSPQMR